MLDPVITHDEEGLLCGSDRKNSQVVVSFAAVAPALLVIHEQITSTPSSTPYISECSLANFVLAREVGSSFASYNHGTILASRIFLSPWD
jgi:hypothetical protein